MDAERYHSSASSDEGGSPVNELMVPPPRQPQPTPDSSGAGSAWPDEDAAWPGAAPPAGWFLRAGTPPTPPSAPPTPPSAPAAYIAAAAPEPQAADAGAASTWHFAS